jgi:hypothetical protein
VFNRAGLKVRFFLFGDNLRDKNLNVLDAARRIDQNNIPYFWNIIKIDG